MKPEVLAIAIGGIGWTVDTVLLYRTHPLWVSGICAVVAAVCFWYARKIA